MLDFSPGSVDDVAVPELSEERGLQLADIPDGSVIDVQTRHSLYTIVKGTDDSFSIQGHARYCPQTVAARIRLCSSGGAVPKVGQFSDGHRLKFEPLEGEYCGRTITTSRIKTMRIRDADEPKIVSSKPNSRQIRSLPD